jgi:hypothetical protein
VGTWTFPPRSKFFGPKIFGPKFFGPNSLAGERDPDSTETLGHLEKVFSQISPTEITNNKLMNKQILTSKNKIFSFLT